MTHDDTGLNPVEKKEALDIVGYANRFSVRPGGKLDFMVSTSGDSYTASMVRFLGGMSNMETRSIPEETVHAQCAGVYKGRLQENNAGSYAELPLPSSWLSGGEFTVQLWIQPTKPAANGSQAIWSARSDGSPAEASLFLDRDGHLLFSLTDGSGRSAHVRTNLPIDAGKWHYIAAQYSAKSSTASLITRRRDGWRLSDDMQLGSATVSLDFAGVCVPKVLLAASTRGDKPDRTHQHYNGKIENPRFFQVALDRSQLRKLWDEELVQGPAERFLVADYDFGVEIGTEKVMDRSRGKHHGILRQSPTRAVTSHAWTGEYVDFRAAPEHYAAVHFHDDDIENAGWETDIAWHVPLDFKSGVYALKLEADGGTDYVTFFVLPAYDAEPAPVLFLAPTNTYLAYANQQLFNLELDMFKDKEMVLEDHDRYIVDHPELGKSTYDTHSDGSGVMYSSRLRPIPNFRPQYCDWSTGSPRHLPADLYIIGWLEKREERYDVATDEDLEREGIELIRPYRVIVTGSHPEYWTRSMMLTLREFMEGGGQVMYLGGNGFYWVTSMDSARPHMIEIRRGNSGIRTWDSAPGELYHSLSGESGGLWRHHGFATQRLLGVGFTAQGAGQACGYRRLPDSFRPEAEFIFEGVGADEPIGNFGYIMGGAVGDEIDRLDFGLGTPEHALWLATSDGLDDYYENVLEEQILTAPGRKASENPLVRADIMYFDIAGGGAVFSVGSMNWAGSLAWNDYNNNVAQISDNVLNHFLK
jgi:N,N-dimethylformamidase